MVTTQPYGIKVMICRLVVGMPIKRKGFALKCNNVTKRNFCLHLVSVVVLCKQRPSPANKPDAVVSRHHQWCTQLYEQGASRSNVVGSQLVAHWIRHHIKNMPEMHTQAKICCTSGGLENVPKCFSSVEMNSTLSTFCCSLGN